MEQPVRHFSTAYLFDVDGVLTDLVEKEVTEKELFDFLGAFVRQGDLVAFNTGRTTGWVNEKIIQPLFEKIEQKELIADIVTIAEKGGTWMTFDEQGVAKLNKDSSMTLPQQVRQAIKQLVQDKYTDAMFFDEGKETMISVEMHDGFAISLYDDRQKEFDKEAEDILSQSGLTDKYKIHTVAISTDIEARHAGKALGVDRLLTIFVEKGITTSKFITFGDSPADIEMADELHTRGKDVIFVYTGDKETLGEITKPYPIEFAAGYTQGTLAYLKSLVKDSDEHRS
jgi:hydroxymethylpyrimidine pyrophosphatase-like HAD family hydrolase